MDTQAILIGGVGVGSGRGAVREKNITTLEILGAERQQQLLQLLQRDLATSKPPCSQDGTDRERKAMSYDDPWQEAHAFMF